MSSPGEIRVTLCNTFGDPWSPKSWSGTPMNLATALNAAGSLERAVDASFVGGPVRKRVLAAKSYLAYGADCQHRCGQLLTSARAKRLWRSLTPRDTHLLHLGIDHLPLPSAAKGRQNFLYIDDTRRAARAAGQPGWHNPRLVDDAERLGRETFEQMEHIFTVSQYVRELLITQEGVDPGKVTAVGTGRGPIRPCGESKVYRGQHILFVAKRGFVGKGGQLLLEAFAIAREKNPAVRLTIAGRAEYPQQFGAIPGVTALGSVTLEDLQRFYEEADLFAMPALHEPWGLVYLEALSCQVPVIGLRRNALPEITQEGRFGFLCDEPDPRLLAASMLDALSDPARLQRMGREGRSHATSYFTWEKTVERILAVMRRVSAPSRPAGVLV